MAKMWIVNRSYNEKLSVSTLITCSKQANHSAQAQAS